MFKVFFNSLRNKILSGYFVVIFILIFIMFWDLFNFNRLNQSYKQIIVQNFSSIVASENMIKALDDQANSVMLLQNKNEKIKAEKLFKDSKGEFFYWLNQAQQSAYTHEERIILDTLNTHYKLFLSGISSLFNNISSTEDKNSEKNYYDISEKISGLKKQCFGLFEINHALVQDMEDQVRNITLTAAFTMLFLTLAGIVISLVFSAKFSKYIVKPVRELTESIQRVSEGSFTQILQTNEQDEIGQLANEFNNMIKRLQKYEELNINKLLSEKKKSETVIESINDPVVMIDENFEILLSNKAFNSIITENNNEKFKQIISDDKIIEVINNLLSNKNESFSESIYIHKDPTYPEKYFDVKCSLIGLPENNKKVVLMVFTDITKYEELDRLKSEFVAKISHELKTPLTSIGMAAGILDDEILGSLSKKQKELLGSIKNDYNRLYSLVKEILELSKIESQKVMLNLVKINLPEFLESCVQKYSLQSEKKGLQIKLHSTENPIFILGDTEYLSSAFGNFIDNSIKFTNAGGKIDVNIKRSGNIVNVQIEDNGQGIDPAYIDKIFDKFVQISDKGPGSVGLGLSIAKEVIQMHKGSINVWSKKEIGSKFEINFPEYKQ